MTLRARVSWHLGYHDTRAKVSLLTFRIRVSWHSGLGSHDTQGPMTSKDQLPARPNDTVLQVQNSHMDTGRNVTTRIDSRKSGLGVRLGFRVLDQVMERAIFMVVLRVLDQVLERAVFTLFIGLFKGRSRRSPGLKDGHVTSSFELLYHYHIIIIPLSYHIIIISLSYTWAHKSCWRRGLGFEQTTPTDKLGMSKPTHRVSFEKSGCFLVNLTLCELPTGSRTTTLWPSSVRTMLWLWL